MTPFEEIASFADVPLSVEVELGRPVMRLREILELEPGSVVELARAAGENVDVRVGGALIGYGEVVVMDNAAAVRITDFKADE
ncbi:MAG: FliM/FliN family flagellar motor switch protein [Bryobacteraceae bacterium]